MTYPTGEMAGSRLALVELRSVTTLISSEFPAQDRVGSGQSAVVIQVDLCAGEMRDLGLGPGGLGKGVTRKKVSSRNQFDIPELVIGFTLGSQTLEVSPVQKLVDNSAALQCVFGTRRVKF